MNTLWASLIDKYGAQWLQDFLALIYKPAPTLTEWNALLGPAAKLDYQRAIDDAQKNAGPDAASSLRIWADQVMAERVRINGLTDKNEQSHALILLSDKEAAYRANLILTHPELNYDDAITAARNRSDAAKMLP